MVARAKISSVCHSLTFSSIFANIGRLVIKQVFSTFMAHTKAVGTTKLGRDSQPKYLGVKLSGGQAAKIGNIIIRQRGTRFVPGKGVRLGTDDTIYSIRDGHVQFITKRVKKYDGRNRLVKIVNVV